ncbi:MAG: FAD:protein FMN transferase [Acidimicrobiia bacterium]
MTTFSGLHHVEHVMGMAVSIDVRDHIDAGAIDEIVAWLHHVDETFSTYRIDSPISRLGLGELTLDDVSDEICEVLLLCEALQEDTGGAFDALAVPAPNGSMLDPSGVVKGWSIEHAAELLVARGARNLCINAGGDVAVRGEPRPGEPWRIGVRHPEHADLSAAVLRASGRLAVATSATYERGAHIIDPATGEATAEVASVTIVGPDLTFADAYATAVFVMGIDGLTWLHTKHPDYGGLVITHDGETLSTPVLDRYR